MNENDGADKLGGNISKVVPGERDDRHDRGPIFGRFLGDGDKDGQEQADEAAPKGFGAMLREAREAAGLGIEDIVARTKIHSSMIAALEEEQLRYLPESVYIRSFIRSICRVTGADPVPIVKAYLRDYPPPEEEILDLSHSKTYGTFGDYPRASGKGLAVLVVVIIVAVLISAVWFGWGSSFLDFFAKLFDITLPGAEDVYIRP